MRKVHLNLIINYCISRIIKSFNNFEKKFLKFSYANNFFLNNLLTYVFNFFQMLVTMRNWKFQKTRKLSLK